MAHLILQATLALHLIIAYIHPSKGGEQVKGQEELKKSSAEGRVTGIEHPKWRFAREAGRKIANRRTNNNKKKGGKKIRKISKKTNKFKNKGGQNKNGSRKSNKNGRKLKKKDTRGKMKSTQHKKNVKQNKKKSRQAIKKSRKIKNKSLDDKKARRNRKARRNKKIKKNKSISKQNRRKSRKKIKIKSGQHKMKISYISRSKAKQACDEKALCQKIKDYIKISNQLRKVRRIKKACDIMDKKANKSLNEFEATVTALDEVLGSTTAKRGHTYRNRFRRSSRSKEEVTSIRDKLKNCKTTIKAKCQKSSVEACQDHTLLTKCETELQDWLTKFGPAKGSCLQASQDCCSCIIGLPAVSADCLQFDQKATVAVNSKKKCTSREEEGSFGFCKKLQVEAAEKGPGAADCQPTGLITTTARPINTASLQAGGPLFADRRPFVCDIGSCFYVKINPSIIQSVCNNSLPPSTFKFNEKLFSYKGKVPPRSSLFESADGTQGIFTCSNGKSLYGSISMEDALGESGTSHIEPHNNDDHIIVSLPHSDIHEDEGISDTLEKHATSDRTAKLLQKGARDKTTKARYSIKFYYTPQFANVTHDISTFIDQALATVNLCYINSRVPLEAYSLCKEQATINDPNSTKNMLENFKNMKNSVNELRGGADTAALLVNAFNKPTKCGRGYINSVVNAASPTISVTKKSCILGYYSLGHEIGHNVGLTHGDGHLIQKGTSSTGRRTIMAYSKPGYKTRVNYYSNPDVIYPETNTPTGEGGVSNSAAILIRNRFALQNIGYGKECDGSLECSSPPMVENGIWTCDEANTECCLMCRPGFASPRTTTTCSTEGAWQEINKMKCLPSIFLIGWTNVKDLEIFDDTDESPSCSSPPPPLDQAWARGSYFFTYDGVVYICGGEHMPNLCISIDGQSQSWKTYTLSASSKGGHSLVPMKNTLYLIGGDYSNGKSMMTTLPLTDDNILTDVPNLSWQGEYQCVIKIDCSNFIVTGGYSSVIPNGFSKNVIKYNVDEKKTTVLASLLTARSEHACGLFEIDNKQWIVVSGGRDKSAEIYDVENDNWQPIGDLNQQMRDHKMIVTEQGVMVIGPPCTGCKSQIEHLDWITKTWKTLQRTMDGIYIGGVVEISRSIFGCEAQG